jgi:hypothetical protein
MIELYEIFSQTSVIYQQFVWQQKWNFSRLAHALENVPNWGYLADVERVKSACQSHFVFRLLKHFSNYQLSTFDNTPELVQLLKNEVRLFVGWITSFVKISEFSTLDRNDFG